MPQDPSRQDFVKETFGRARLLPVGDQAGFVRSACAPWSDGDALAAEIMGLLSADSATDDLLSSPTGCAEALGASLISELSVADMVGSSVGPYRLLEQIGEGGFGLVYMAEQDRPFRRRVAIKIIKLGMDTAQVMARFEQERQALAMMDHPNIARVLDAGATPSGRPYFVMELVRGEPITLFCDARKLGIPERLQLFVQVCRAVQHAHQKGIIHRDIKPSNVLVTIGDGDRPVAKVIDFGIAKAMQSRLTEQTLFTEFRQMVGTPEYMSPEQAGRGGAGGLDIDTRSDVYSLGVLLYELLAGMTPFDAERMRSAAYEELQRIIREVDPPRPSTRLSQSASLAEIASRRCVDPDRLRGLVRGELDWVVMKCLEKDRARRYAGADDLARDLERHARQEPLEAGPPSTAYRVQKFVRRNRGPVIAASLLFAVLLLGLTGTSAGAVWALNERNRSMASERQAVNARLQAEAASVAEAAERGRADRAAEEATRLAYGLGISSAIAALESGNIERAAAALHECPEPLRGWEWEHLAWATNPSTIEFQTPADTDALAGSADGRTLVTRGANGDVLVFEVATGAVLKRISTRPGGSMSPYGLELDPRAQLLIVRQRTGEGTNLVSVIERSTGRTLWSLPGLGIAAFAQGGRSVLAAVPGGVSVRDSLTGGEIDFVPVEGQPPMGVFAGIGSTDPIIIRVTGIEYVVYSLAKRRQIAKYVSNENAVARDEPVLIYLDPSGDSVRRLDLETGEDAVLMRAPPPSARIDGIGHGLIAMTSADGRLRAISTKTGETVWAGYFPRAKWAWQPAADGRTIFTIDLAGRVAARSIATAQQPFVVAKPGIRAYAARVSPFGNATVVTGWGEARFYDAVSGEHLWSSYHTTEKLYASAFSPDGRMLAVGGTSPNVALLDTRDGRVLSLLPLPEPGLVTALAWSPAGDRVVVGLMAGDMIEYDPHRPDEPPTTWQSGHDSAVADMAFSSDGRRLATASAADLGLPDSWAQPPPGRNQLILWDAATRTPVRTIDGGEDGYRRLAFAPDDSMLAATASRSLSLHELGGDQSTLTVPIVNPRALAFSPDGSRLALSAAVDELKLLDVRDLKTLATLTAAKDGFSDLRFTPEGDALIMASQSTPVAAWERKATADPERRLLVARAQSIVASLFGTEDEVAARVVQRIEEDESLSEPLRRAALAAAMARGNNPNRLTNIAALSLNREDLPIERLAELAELAAIGAEAAPQSAWAWSTLAFAELRLDRYEQAIAAARRSVQLVEGTNMVAEWAAIAIAAHQLGRVHEALEAWQEASRQAEIAGDSLPRSDVIWLGRARALFEVE